MATGLYFEDFEVGMSMTTAGRTITEADIVNFAGLSGDYNRLHTDAEYARTTEFGQRIAHGALGFSIATGLSYQLGFLNDTAIAFREVNWKFASPIYIGDTVHCDLKVREKKEARRLGGGTVTIDVKLVNQSGQTTQKGQLTVIIRSRPAGNGSEEATG